MITDWKNKRVAVIGFGIEGISSAFYLLKKGVQITILDQKDEKDLNSEDVHRVKESGVKIITGSRYLEKLIDYDVLVRSPGVKRNLPQIIEAEKKGIVITSQTKLFFDFCPAKIIGVTGTKGKGTTSSLIFEMLKQQGFAAYLGGNIGTPPFEFLDDLTKQSIVVLELSSFQLQDLEKSPHIAVVLMITSEHLNYHTDIYEYINAKRNIVRFQTSSDIAILNRDYPASHESDVHTQARIYQVSRERETAGDGCFIRNDEIWIRINGKEQEILGSKELLLPGRHNLENVCAAVMAAKLSLVSLENIRAVLKTFKGLEHRLELVGTRNNIDYYDDSFSTTPETTIAAILAFNRPEVLIIGGSSKGSDFSDLAAEIAKAENIRAIIGIGEEWGRIKEEILNRKKTIFIVEGAKTMQQIVAASSKIAQPGDVILLSPACASFDMFKNYKQRGELFKEEVLKLKT